MKNIIFLVAFAVLFLACRQQKVVNDANESNTKLSFSLESSMNFLASNEVEGRDTGSKGLDKAASFIAQRFDTLGIKPYYVSYRDEFMVDSVNTYNIVGWLEGTDEKLKEEFIVVGAHYDHVGRRARPFEGDSIANGANDNATGTATVLKIAEHFANNKTNKRSLIFALFSAEEIGLLGSKHLAERMKSDSLNIYTMVNFEMTGVPFNDDRSYLALITGHDLSNMAEKINEYAGEEVVGKSFVAKKYGLFMRSDNYPFYKAMGIPAQTVGTCDLTNFDYYHHVDDENDKMNFKHMQNVVDKMIPAIEGMANSEIQEIKMIVNE